MGLKSLIEKIMLVNETVDYLDSAEGVIKEKHSQKRDFKALKKLEKIFNNSIQQTQNQELKTGLEIILILISHENENIKASALGKLFLLIDDRYIQKLIVKELKNISNNGNENISESAHYSLDLIAREIHGLEIFEITFSVLAKFMNTIKLKASKFEFSSVFNKPDSTIISKIKVKNTFQGNNLFNSISSRWHTFNHQIDKIIPYSEEMENFSDKNFIKQEIIHLPLQNLESSEEDSLQKLTDFYVSTFMEKGHLRRLIALLDDHDHKVQQMGFNALIGIVEGILANSNEKFIKPLQT